MNHTQDLILNDIAAGMSMVSACERHNTAHLEFLRKVDADLLTKAREAQAEAHFDQILELEEQCLRGDLAPQAFKAVLDSRKWRLGRFEQRLSGARSENDAGDMQLNVIFEESTHA